MVYPHVCGATNRGTGRYPDSQGLSPRVWGNRGGRTHWRGCVVYPHVCGATDSSGRILAAGKGLSPRVWGNPISQTYRHCAARSIPTCVGQPASPSGQETYSAVYPHVCGATQRFLPDDRGVRGLSPRVWGNQYRLRAKTFAMRSIPTCVGQPDGHIQYAHRQKVYPHVCGATWPRYLPFRRVRGLSPRVWGNQQVLRIRMFGLRSIPTCVGQPTVADVRAQVVAVYPHVCGATPIVAWNCLTEQGLSPRVWGNLDNDAPFRS